MGFDTDREAAEQLLQDAGLGDESPKETTVTTDDQTAKPEDQKEATPPEKAKEEPTEVKLPDYKAQAFEKAKELLKDKTDLTDAEIEQVIYQAFINRQKKIQYEVESRKKAEAENKDLLRYKTFYEELNANPYWKKLQENKARIVDLEAEQEDEQTYEGQKELRELWTEVKNLAAALQAKDKAQEQSLQTKQLEQQAKELDDKIDEELTDLSKRYPLFKQWMDSKNRLGFPPPELEEVYDLIDKENVSLTTAVKLYFADKKMPEVVEKTKQATIEGMKKKAGQRAESSGNAKVDTKPVLNTLDTMDVAERLLQDSGIKF